MKHFLCSAVPIIENVAICLMSSRVVFALLTLIVSHSTSPQAGICQAPSPQILANSRGTTGSQYTAQAVLDQWEKSVNSQRWMHEYQLYAGFQQAKFSYQVMVSTRELQNDQDLSAALTRTLYKFGFPQDILNAFPSQRRELRDISNSEEHCKQGPTHLMNLNARIERWEREVQPLPIDWSGMIDELQPLLTASHHRHRDELHPSSTGISHHLSYHRFEQSVIQSTHSDRAIGTTIPVIRDSMGIMVDDANSPNGTGKNAIWTAFSRFRTGMGLSKEPIKREPVEIVLLQEAGSWKITSLPFR